MELTPLVAQPIAAGAIRHIFSIDLEEYFQVNAFEGVVSRSQWDSYTSRVEASTDVLLGLLADGGASATFFCLGWIAERHPHLIRRIADAGHEIASHGWWHRRVPTSSPLDLERELRDSKALLEDVTGTEVVGFRAPSFSIIPGVEWAIDLLIHLGYRYDSSLFPIRRRGYGYPSALTVPHLWSGSDGTLLELPPVTLECFGLRIPAAGGGYLRHFPLVVVQTAIRRQSARGYPATFYVHPWEVDPDQPRLPVRALTRVRHYRGLSRTRERLRKLLIEFRFASAAHYMNEHSRIDAASLAVAVPAGSVGRPSSAS
jgi:polysaccharide deacetylase family protein (PEP-CTERM system associated)